MNVTGTNGGGAFGTTETGSLGIMLNTAETCLVEDFQLSASGCTSFSLTSAENDVPTLSQWGLIILALNLLIISLIAVKRRRTNFE